MFADLWRRFARSGRPDATLAPGDQARAAAAAPRFAGRNSPFARLAGLFAVTGALSVAAAPLPARLATPPSTVVSYRDGSPANVSLAPDDRWRIAVNPDEVDRGYVDALLTYEDRRFWWHPGVDPVAILRAALTNTSRGRRVSGASTITMQLVRMLEPRPRTPWSKVVEAHRALTVELWMSKSEILAAYLQFAPFGRNLEGVEAAALTAFGHRADALSDTEIATLLAIPQDPNRRYPNPAHAEALRAGRGAVSARLPDLEVHETEPVPTALLPFPREAPHAARWLRSRYPDRTALHTTLDRDAQRVAEGAVAGVAPERADQGIHHAAVVVLHHPTGELRALVGGFRFDGADGAQIPAFTAARSPGSALKPFVYALGIERGVAIPEQLVLDVPLRFSDWAPENYDRSFRGLVRLEDALSQSLNLPFVSILRDIGVDALLSALRAGGVTRLSDEPGHYGLSAAIGGIEVRPLDLAQLYGALARGGTPVAAKVLPDEPTVEGPRLFSAGAAWLTSRALRLRDRPDFPSRRDVTRMPPTIAWKTGTSVGHRDAWAAGYGPEHVAVVWMGNLDQRPAAALVGADSAGPVLFDVLEGLREGSGGAAGPPPQELRSVEVCAFSGYLPGPACPQRSGALALARAVPTTPCPYHRLVDVDPRTGFAVSPTCAAADGRVTEPRAYLSVPAAARRWFLNNHRDLAVAPPDDPSCPPADHGDGPRVLSPPSGLVVQLIPGVAADRQEIPFEADHDEADTTLSWFVDGALHVQARADRRVWWTPSPGRHEVTVVDGSGRRATVIVEVRHLDAPVTGAGSASERPRPRTP